LSADSEESVFNQSIEKLSLSAGSSLELTQDKNAVDSASIEKVESSLKIVRPKYYEDA
jgi:hypothetical protein